MRSLLFLISILTMSAAHANVPVVTVQGLTIDFSPFTLVASPGETLSVNVPDGFQVVLQGKQQTKESSNSWALDAPTAPGHYEVKVADATGREMHLNLFVTVPANAVTNETLNAYRIGPPPPGKKTHSALYKPPTGFIEVTEAMHDLQLSPNFRLKQFLCKQADGYPKYIVLQENLLALLEGLLQLVRERGYPAETFGVISGYRTPWYNKKIGNVPNSRHVYGDAMDFFIDVDADGKMDDLNRDGIHNRQDVDLLADIAEEYMARPKSRLVHGGVGRYGKTHRHGGFVHIDTRGYFARW